jgi:hypothetical protein
MSKYIISGLKLACSVTGVDQSDFIARRTSGVATIGPAKPPRGKASQSTLGDLIGMKIDQELRELGCKPREANQRASRFLDAMDQYPNEERLTCFKLENGATRILPSKGLDLSTGFNSGGYVVSGIEFSILNIREIIEKKLAAHPVLFNGDGEPDEA